MFALRLATLGDLPALRRLIDESVRGLSAAHYTPEQIESGLHYVFGPDTQLIADGTYHIVESAGRLAAAGGWSKRQTLYGGDQHKSAADPPLDPRTDAARIRAFFVHPDFARRGLGRMLFEACLAAAAESGFRSFELGATLPGEPLYASLGFVARERADAHLPDGVVLPIVRMTRAIVVGEGD
ncbi:MAG: acetyltransferase family protein [Gemmatimonadetes bacterium]|nr:acetyltransferase family protein [Gemmatimonadota bacterium]